MNYDNHPPRHARGDSPASAPRHTRETAPTPRAARRPAAGTAQPRRAASAAPESRRTSRASASSARASRPVDSARRARVAGEVAQYRQSKRTTSGARRTAPPSPKKNGFLSVLKVIPLVLLMLLAKIGDLLKALNRKLDRFRRGEASTIVVNSLLGGALLVAVLAVCALNYSSLRMTCGSFLTSIGKLDAAQAIVQTAEKEDGPSERADRLRRRIAARYIDRGEYDAALSQLSLLTADEEATRLTVSARSRKAEALYQAGSYSEAAAVFDLISHTPEGASRYSDCLCAMAVEAYLRGEENTARQLLISAGNAYDHIEEALRRVTGDAQRAQSLLNSDFFSVEALRHLAEASGAVREALSQLPHGKIAAGNQHTVGLRADGTVIACGSNDYGQLNVSSWNDITMLAAGASHTVGLRADGTVVACGDNSQGQLAVEGWSDIIMIAASAYDTLGLRSDGIVVACGMHAYDVTAWRDIVSISGGAYSAACLSQQGTMRASHKSAQMSTGTLLASLSVSGTYSAGVGYDGSLVSSFAGAPRWSDLASVTASPTGLLAITNTGTVRTYFFRASDDPGISVNGSVVEIASSGTHHVLLTADGRVHAFGLNDRGQLNVSGWQL